MSAAPFDPQHLTPPISLNRVRVVDLPGLHVDAGVRDKTGYELISAMALAGMIREQAGALRLDPTMEDHQLNRALDACLDSDSRDICAAAERVARRAGRNLGYLLLALRRGDPVNRAARDEWDESYWAHWAGIRLAWLGGGIASGRLGPRLCRYGQDIFAEAGCGAYAIRLSPYGSALPLVGMARRAPEDSPSALVFDFGQTAIKRAVARYEAGELNSLERLDDDYMDWSHAARDPESEAARLLDRMIALIVETRAQVGSPRGAIPVLISVSAYVRDGQPLRAQHGTYVEIARITDNMQHTIADRLRAAWGEEAHVVLEHDGTAAATAHAGSTQAAVITIGTALGIGFPMGEAGLRAVSQDFGGCRESPGHE